MVLFCFGMFYFVEVTVDFTLMVKYSVSHDLWEQLTFFDNLLSLRKNWFYPYSSWLFHQLTLGKSCWHGEVEKLSALLAPWEWLVIWDAMVLMWCHCNVIWLSLQPTMICLGYIISFYLIYLIFLLILFKLLLWHRTSHMTIKCQAIASHHAHLTVNMM